MSYLQQGVRDRYGAIAASVQGAPVKVSCCGPGPNGCSDPITANLYSDLETSGLPANAVAASLGCGNPTALLALEADRPSSTSGRAAASTSCCRRSGLVPPAKSMAWT